jgi:hypothetical protein
LKRARGVKREQSWWKNIRAPSSTLERKLVWALRGYHAKKKSETATIEKSAGENRFFIDSAKSLS